MTIRTRAHYEQALQALDHRAVELDVLEHLDHDVLGRHRQRVEIHDELARDVDPHRVLAAGLLDAASPSSSFSSAPCTPPRLRAIGSIIWRATGVTCTGSLRRSSASSRPM